MKANDLVGQVFSRLTVVEIAGRNKKQNLLWRCCCTCGGEAVAPAYDLRAGKVKSCGCLAKEGLSIKHGMARGGAKRSKEYSIWAAIHQRCYNPKDNNYKHYGGRGITVCPEWQDFESFYADMGDKPPGKSIDRINNDEGYNKSNCEWRDLKAQSRNRRDNVWVIVDGERMVVTDALSVLGIRLGHLHYYMKTRNLTHQGAVDLWQERKKAL